MAQADPVPRRPGKAPWRTILFRLEAHGASQVSVVGDFNDWNAEKHGLCQDAGGVWECRVPLPPGRYAYRFVVDGVSRSDPLCPHREETPDGDVRCFVEVSAPPEG